MSVDFLPENCSDTKSCLNSKGAPELGAGRNNSQLVS